MDYDLFIRLASAYVTAGSLFFAYNHIARLIQLENKGLTDDMDGRPLPEALREILLWPAHVWPFKRG